MHAGLLRLGRAALDLLLPPTCLTCDAPVDVPGQFCPSCFGQVGFVSEPCCACCGVPFAYRGQGHAGGGGTALVCPTCRDHPPPWDQARAALRYDAQSRRILLPFKHGDRTEHAASLARLMARAAPVLLRRAEVVVPVPLHRRRLLSRRYNQAALLAHEVGRIAGRPVLPDAIRRLRPTRSLGNLSAAERAVAVEGVFAVPPSRLAGLAGRRVLLIDDVMTSGATARACTEALLEAGAAGVDVLLAARVPDPRLR